MLADGQRDRAPCLDANIASTAAIVRGAEAASWLEQLGLPSRLVGSDGLSGMSRMAVEGDDLPALPRGAAEPDRVEPAARS